MKLFITMLGLISSLAFAETQSSTAASETSAFEVVHAGDQEVITSESLDKEFQQILALSMWQKAQSKLKMTQLKFGQAQRDLTRAKELRKSGTITESKYSSLYFEYRTLEVDVINLPIDVSKYRLTAQYHHLRVLEEGNPGRDHRLAQVKLMLEGTDLELRTLGESLKLAATARELADVFVKSGQRLKSTAALSAAELERREVVLQSTLIHTQELENQVELAKMARAGFERTAARLLKEQK